MTGGPRPDISTILPNGTHPPHSQPMPLELRALAAIATIAGVSPTAEFAQRAPVQWRSIGVAAQSQTTLLYDAQSVDSSAGGIYQLLVREEDGPGRSQHTVTLDGTKHRLDAIVYRAAFDCSAMKVRTAAQVYFLGSIRVPGQRDPGGLESAWRSPRPSEIVGDALKNFCASRESRRRLGSAERGQRLTA